MNKNAQLTIALTALLGALLMTAREDAKSQEIAPPVLEFAFEVRAEVADPIVVGELPTGQTRRIIDITGGTVEGPGIKGRVLRGGADWQLIRRSDGFTDIDARYALETEEGHIVYVTNVGIRHAPPDVMARLNAGEVVDQADIYFRAIPKFETAAPELQWLMRSIFVSTGERYPNGVVIRFWKVH
ncbi:MAG: DUF3237 domain-containing protein [Gammaproteobacteria bacterium]